MSGNWDLTGVWTPCDGNCLFLVKHFDSVQPLAFVIRQPFPVIKMETMPLYTARRKSNTSDCYPDLFVSCSLWTNSGD